MALNFLRRLALQEKNLDVSSHLDFVEIASELVSFLVGLRTYQHPVCWRTCFENRAVYEIMSKNMVEPDRPQMTMWHKRLACWITKATDSHTLCSTYWFSTATMDSRTRLNAALHWELPVLFS